MRFNLEIRKIEGSIRIVLPIFSKQPRSFGRTEAVIDTGSPKTIISAGDAIKLNIPFTNLESTTPLTGLGKGKTPMLLMKKFMFSIRDSEVKEVRNELWQEALKKVKGDVNNASNIYEEFCNFP